MPREICKGVFVGILIFVLFTLGISSRVNARGSINWAMGVYWGGYSGSGVTGWGVDFYNSGLPADSNGDQTFAAFSASILGSSEFLPQVAIENVQGGPYVFEDLLYVGGGSVNGFGTMGIATQTESGLLGAWHTMELKTRTVTQGSTEIEYLDWWFDGVVMISYEINSCTAPCSFHSFDLDIVPSMEVASPDNSTTHFSSLNVHGYFQEPLGTSLGSQYLYPAYWGNATSGANCHIGSYQTSDAYLERLNEAPSNVPVTGHVYNANWGATDEWGIGNGTVFGYSGITDAQMSSHCSSGPPQIA